MYTLTDVRANPDFNILRTALFLPFWMRQISRKISIELYNYYRSSLSLILKEMRLATMFKIVKNTAFILSAYSLETSVADCESLRQSDVPLVMLAQEVPDAKVAASFAVSGHFHLSIFIRASMGTM